MNYLSASEYEAYGVAASTPESWIAAASALIDAHCRRATLGVTQYTERMRLAPGCQATRLSFLPLATVAPATSPLLTVRVRYGCARRGEVGSDLAADVATVFGLPGTWSEVALDSVDLCLESGELSLPGHPLGLRYNEIEVSYNAGFEPLAEAVKVACAQIVRNGQATPALNVRSSSLERMHMEYFSDALIDSNVRKLLAPFVAQKVG